MKTLYFDCAMGAAGDMLMGALSELHPDRDGFLTRLNRALAGRAVVSAAPDSKCGISGTHISVSINGREEGEEPDGHCDAGHHHHHHTSISEIFAFLDHAEADSAVIADAKAVYTLLAGAESQVHGLPIENIHFHEIGSLDALADILGVSMLIHELAPDKIVCSPINVGSGTVKCAHGILPVPAPATELILRGVPVYGGSIRGELCTPTGAALLKHFSTGFGEIPLMSVSAAGYGTGTKNFDAANVVRAMIGESRSDAGEILELKCNLDDMTAEEVGYAQEMLFSAGALDVYTAPIGMKKNRPAVLLTCMCRREQRDEMLRCIFANTSTLGVREYVCSRYTLSRREESVETEYGAVHIKSASGWGVSRSKPEYEDVARIARETGRSFHEVASWIMSALNNAPVSH